jgi:thiamine biosynthesis lipoprotein ApbE
MDNKLIHIRLSRNHMNTTFHLTIATLASRCRAAETTLEQAHRIIARCEKEYSEFLPNSPVYRLNHAPVGTVVEFPPLAKELFLRAEVLREQTRGAFHYGAKGNLHSTPFEWVEGQNGVRKCIEGAWLGFGAIGKGFALDKARELIERDGFENFNLNGGGSSILMKGYCTEGQPWSWAWSWLKSEQGKPLGLQFQHDSGRPVAIGVSGTQEKGAHLIATIKNAAPVKSALVAADCATDADALSTALFVSGWDQFLQTQLPATKELAVAVIDGQDCPRWNGGFQNAWGALASLLLALPVFFTLLLTVPAYADEAPRPLEGTSEVVAPPAPETPPPTAEAEAAVGASDSGEIDLGDLGISQFNPYLFERDPLWALLPFAALVLVLLHLKKPPRPSIRKEESSQ